MEQSEDSKNFAGKGGFIWFVAVVERINDPLKLGRCRIRCVGWHTDNKQLLPSDSLPWAQVLLPTNNTNPYPPREGDMVVGFFTDGENGQDPIIMGVMPGIPLDAANPQKGFSDPRSSSELAAAPVKPDESATNYPRKLDEPTTSRLARNDSDYPSAIVAAKKAKKASKVEPDSYYAAKYPYNNVHESESGHALEFDDTKGAERIHLYHRSGSYVEYGPLGDRAERIQRNKFSVVVGDDSIYVQGQVNIFVDGTVNATAAKFNLTGDVAVTGSITATGTITDSGATLATHTHPDPQGGSTSPPN
jgi:hypothetical protein